MSTQDPADTKAAWKRRALRAEALVDTLKKIRETEGRNELRLVYVSAMRAVAIKEIEEALDALKESLSG